MTHGVFSLQDARKGVLFDDFPPVLQLQLKRFEYDFQRDIMVKVQPLHLQCNCQVFPCLLYPLADGPSSCAFWPHPVPIAPTLCPSPPPCAPSPHRVLFNLCTNALSGCTYTLHSACCHNCLGLIASALQINDRYEFPDELDLDVGDGKFLSPDADRSVRNLYKLHSVLVHSGGVHGGHYYAYIRPATKQWLKFDDEKVCQA